jgi:chromosomal replication initiation ATPase DnaA
MMYEGLQAVAGYRSRAVTGNWKPEEKVLRLVSAEFRIPASAILAGSRARDISRARSVWWYLCSVVLYDEPPHKAGLRLGVERKTMYEALRRVEDWRDDAAFDARVTLLEALIEGA